MKRTNNTASLHHGGLRKDHCPESGGHLTKVSNEASQHGKFSSPGRVSNDSKSVDRYSQPPPAVTPSKDECRLSRPKYKAPHETVSKSKASRKTPPKAINENNDNRSKASHKTPPGAINESKNDRSYLKQIVATCPSRVSTLSCIAIDWVSPSMTQAEISKYLTDEDSVPKSTEEQLEFLMNKFPLPELKTAYYVTAGKIGADLNSVNLPSNARTDAVVKSFIAMMYDHRSMMYNDTRSAHR
jgi:hypothetical protein